MRLLSTCLCLALATRLLGATPAPLAGQRVLVLGDSITQDGRYVSLLEYYLLRSAPSVRCDLISLGLSSETVSGLSEPGHPYPRPCVLERLDRALRAVRPQVVLACYGMNDGIYHPAAPERTAAFLAGLRQLIARVRASGARLVLVTPPVFDPQPLRARTVGAGAAGFGYDHPFVDYDAVLAEFARLELALAEPGVAVIDLHGPLAADLAAARAVRPDATFSPDGVHPDEAGQLRLARIIATGFGLAIPALPPDAELKRILADPVFPLIRDRRSLRSEAWLPFVGYTRDGTFKSDSVAAAEDVAARLERQIEALAGRR